MNDRKMWRCTGEIATRPARAPAKVHASQTTILISAERTNERTATKNHVCAPSSPAVDGSIMSRDTVDDADLWRQRVENRVLVPARHEFSI